MPRSALPDEPLVPEWCRNARGETVHDSKIASVWAIRLNAANHKRYLLRWIEPRGARRVVKEKSYHDRRTMMREFQKKELMLTRTRA